MSPHAEPSTPDLIEQVLESHRKVEGALSRMAAAGRRVLSEAVKAGEALICLKEREGRHGSWMRWVSEQFPEIDHRTVNDYMRLATEWHRLEPKLAENPKLGIKKALHFLRGQSLEPAHSAATLLRCIQPVSPDKTSSERSAEQARSFAFRKGVVFTYDGDVMRSCACPEDFGIRGAVEADLLLALLRMLAKEEEHIKIEQRDDPEVVVVEGEEHPSPFDAVLLITGGGQRAQIRMQKAVTLPTGEVVLPDQWRPLPPGLVHAVAQAAACASKDDSTFALNCVHLHPEFVEGCDNFRLIRYPMPAGVTKPLMVRSQALHSLPDLGMAEFAETVGWLHFRNPDGLTFSYRAEKGTYPDVSEHLAAAGERLVLPAGLRKAVAKAALFCGKEEGGANVRVTVALRQGKMIVAGRGGANGFEQELPTTYRGPDASFLMRPKTLMEIIDRRGAVYVESKALRVEGEGYRFAASTRPP